MAVVGHDILPANKPLLLPPDLLPAPFRYLSDGLPVAQAVDVIRSVAYFHGAGTTQPTLILLLWAAVARRQPRPRPAVTQTDRLPRERLCPQTHVLAWVRDERPMEEHAPRPRLGS